MLRLMRDYATSWMIKIILGAIVVVFVFWGVGSFRNRKASVIASVDDSVVTIEEYNQTYNRLLEQMRQRFGNNLNQDLLRMLRVDRQAMDQIINERVMLQEARRLNLSVSEEEIVDSIKEIPAFQSSGQFDSRQYQRVLSLNRMSPESFEKAQKNNLLMQKLRTIINSNVHVSTHEALSYFQWMKASVDIDYVLFEPDQYTAVDISDEEVEAAYEENKADYKTDPEVKVRYIRFDPKQFKDQAGVSTEEIEDYYYSNPAQFETPKTVEARHILIKVDNEASAETVAAAKESALDVWRQIENGAAFEDMARQYSEGPTAEKGGYLGAFRKADMVAPFAEKAFSMSPGEVSGPVRTRFGWHLIKVENVNPASTRSLEAASAEIAETLLSEKAKLVAYDAAEDFYVRTFDGEDITTAAIDPGDIHTTDFFDRSGPQESDVSNPGEFASAAFDLQPGQVSEIQELGNAYYILQVVEKKPGVIPPLAEVRSDVAQKLIETKQARQAKADAEKLLQQLKASQAEAQTMVETSAGPFRATGFFERNAEIPGIGYENGISRAAFKLSPTNPYPETVIEGQNGYYVIRFRERKQPDPDAFEAERGRIEQMLLKQKQTKVFDTWLAAIKSQSDITIREGFLQEQ